jgi:hypothetical protein
MTAVEWLVEQLFELRNPTLNQIEILKQTKEMEKQQIIDAYADGRISVIDREIISYEQYYNEKFKKKEI